MFFAQVGTATLKVDVQELLLSRLQQFTRLVITRSGKTEEASANAQTSAQQIATKTERVFLSRWSRRAASRTFTYRRRIVMPGANL